MNQALKDYYNDIIKINKYIEEIQPIWNIEEKRRQALVNWPAPPKIHRGLEWPQCLNCSLFDCSLFSANFLILLLILLCYSSVSYVIYWPAPPTIHRGLEWPQCLNCSLFFVLCLSSNFLILLLILLYYSSVSSVISL